MDARLQSPLPTPTPMSGCTTSGVALGRASHRPARTARAHGLTTGAASSTRPREAPHRALFGARPMLRRRRKSSPEFPNFPAQSRCCQTITRSSSVITRTSKPSKWIWPMRSSRVPGWTPQASSSRFRPMEGWPPTCRTRRDVLRCTFDRVQAQAGQSRFRSLQDMNQPGRTAVGSCSFLIGKKTLLMAVSVKTRPALTVSRPRRVIPPDTAAANVAIDTYDVMPDDRHFLVVRDNSSASRQSLSIITNWFRELNARVR